MSSSPGHLHQILEPFAAESEMRLLLSRGYREVSNNRGRMMRHLLTRRSQQVDDRLTWKYKHERSCLMAAVGIQFEAESLFSGFVRGHAAATVSWRDGTAELKVSIRESASDPFEDSRTLFTRTLQIELETALELLQMVVAYPNNFPKFLNDVSAWPVEFATIHKAEVVGYLREPLRGEIWRIVASYGEGGDECLWDVGESLLEIASRQPLNNAKPRINQTEDFFSKALHRYVREVPLEIGYWFHVRRLLELMEAERALGFEAGILLGRIQASADSAEAIRQLNRCNDLAWLTPVLGNRVATSSMQRGLVASVLERQNALHSGAALNDDHESDVFQLWCGLAVGLSSATGDTELVDLFAKGNAYEFLIRYWNPGDGKRNRALFDLLSERGVFNQALAVYFWKFRGALIDFTDSELDGQRPNALKDSAIRSWTVLPNDLSYKLSPEDKIEAMRFGLNSLSMQPGYAAQFALDCIMKVKDELDFGADQTATKGLMTALGALIYSITPSAFLYIYWNGFERSEGDEDGWLAENLFIWMDRYGMWHGDLLPEPLPDFDSIEDEFKEREDNLYFDVEYDRDEPKSEVDASPFTGELEKYCAHEAVVHQKLLQVRSIVRQANSLFEIDAAVAEVKKLLQPEQSVQQRRFFLRSFKRRARSFWTPLTSPANQWMLEVLDRDILFSDHSSASARQWVMQRRLSLARLGSQPSTAFIRDIQKLASTGHAGVHSWLLEFYATCAKNGSKIPGFEFSLTNVGEK